MVFTERQAIRQRMGEIREERRELNNEYTSLMDRLRELDNEEREALDTETVVGNLAEAVSVLGKLIPSVPVDLMVNHVATMMMESGMEVAVTNHVKNPPVAPIEVIREQQYVESRKHLQSAPVKTTKKRPTYPGLDERIIDVLKESRQEMKLTDIRNKVQPHYTDEITEGNFHARVTKLVNENPKIIKPSRGYYKYQI